MPRFDEAFFLRFWGYRLHLLKGQAKNRWSIWGSGNWRLTLDFKDGNAYVLDDEGYH